MPVIERLAFYQLLKKQKEDEKEAREEAIKKAEADAKSKPKNRSFKSPRKPRRR